MKQENVHKVDEIRSSQALKIRVAGRLKYFVEEWKSITSNKFVINSIKEYKICFTSQPFQTQVSTAPLLQGSQSLDDVREAINKLLELGAIRPCIAEKPQFVSSYFLVPKADGSERFVLNLKKLNEFIQTTHFKLEDSRAVTNLISKNDFLAKLDLENAYFLILIDENSSKYLRFIFQGQYFEFLCLPFGLNVAPYIFTKILKPIVTYLRKQGYSSVIYFGVA